MKPSCAVMKLRLFRGDEEWYRSCEPHIRVAKSPFSPGLPLINCLTLSRYLPFHSVHEGSQWGN